MKTKFQILQMIPVARKVNLIRLETDLPLPKKNYKKVKEPVLFICLVRTTQLDDDGNLIREFEGVAPLNLKAANGEELTIDSFFKTSEWNWEIDDKLCSSVELWSKLKENQTSHDLKEEKIFKSFVADKKEESKLKK